MTTPDDRGVGRALTYEDIFFATVANIAPTVQRHPDGTFTYRYVFPVSEVPALPTHINLERHNKELLAATVAETLGVPLSEDEKDRLWDAVSACLVGDDDA